MTFALLSETPIPMVELKEELKKIKKRDEELNFRAAKTEEYLSLFSLPKQSDAKDLRKTIEDANISRLKPEHITKILDLLPQSVEELKAVLSGYALSLSAESFKKIVDLVQECRAGSK